ncbi:MAG: hypothetical protein HC824_03475 [Synechococcales cyanobacterium RM1_1_8]|nr:hypothetical protein [Synechococcales cyanobacterium RM1_1_8]
MANDPSSSAQNTPSRQSLKRDRRAAQSASPAGTDPSQPASAASNGASNGQPSPGQPVPGSEAPPKPGSIEQTHALVVSSRRKRYTDNRPVDPSPIQVSQTVRMAGLRPIGASPNINGSPSPNFTQSPQIMNRPIAPNTSPADEEMLGYLD